ncbi:TetR/AcrR family transcriptional regulator [Novosphingobium sp. Fuku2-ISO-50]|uniref:TetR/AcrR family transcriptional regulator n=1 Tax=Novosphingobium sp. Fuku2-ISO-50 TaxID=1739114 RepID=UPI001E5E8EF4|nr:TetR/AcrR family transcriptional regulator [Novosphingobium sp. Fuku2-ISO-50]
MSAVYELLRDRSVRDLTMEMIAREAKVGKPTLYKWWPSKAALVLDMFSERIAAAREPLDAATTEQTIRLRVSRLIDAFNGKFGKVLAELIAEGQSDPTILTELYERHIRPARAATATQIEAGKASGELRAELDTTLLIDTLFGPIYFYLLIRPAPLTQTFGEALVDAAFRGITD